jgi:hypothetical protein
MTDNRSTYRLLNPTNSKVTLKRDKIVGRFTHLQEEEILCTLDTEDSDENASSVNDVCEDPTREEEYIKTATDLGIDLPNTDFMEDHKNKLVLCLHRDVFAKYILELGM